MHPVAFSIFGLEIRWYGILMATSILLATLLANRFLNKRGMKGDAVYDAVFACALLGIVGARAGYVLTNWGDYSQNLKEIFQIWHGGLSFHGGIIGGIVGGLIYTRWSKALSFYQLADAVVPGIALGVALVRIGNFMNGDIVGRANHLPFPFSFAFPDPSDPAKLLPARHPTEIYGLIVGLILFPWMLALYKRRFFDGYVFWSFIMNYSWIRSIIEEPFRDNPLYLKIYLNDNFGIGFLTLTQIVSIPLIYVSWVMVSVLKGKSKSKEPQEPKPSAPPKLPKRKKTRPKAIVE